MPRQFDPAQPELMDIPQPVSQELRADLSNLVSLNRHFGSHRLLLRFAKRWLQPGKSYTVLDLATGAADLPKVLVHWARNNFIKLTVDCVDAQSSTLAIARESCFAYPEIHFHEADVRSFDQGKTYDLVLCSLALHHFSEPDALRILTRCKELSHRWVLVSDLERSWFANFGIWFITKTLYRDEMTVHDARLSAKRAFSGEELAVLAKAAGWPRPGHGRFLFARQAVWLEPAQDGKAP
jgi:2-polyprenyl-3-methyl-5-hydroxy-6-metoxy-1,4-benzoquinol methylase